MILAGSKRCPECRGTGGTDYTGVCPVCHGRKVVPLFKAIPIPWTRLEKLDLGLSIAIIVLLGAGLVLGGYAVYAIGGIIGWWGR